MNRTARAAVTLPLIVLVAGGLVEIACRGGGPFDGLDGGYNDGEATRQMPGRATASDGGGAANDDACATASVTSDDDAGPGCASDD